MIPIQTAVFQGLPFKGLMILFFSGWQFNDSGRARVISGDSSAFSSDSHG